MGRFSSVHSFFRPQVIMSSCLRPQECRAVGLGKKATMDVPLRLPRATDSRTSWAKNPVLISSRKE